MNDRPRQSMTNQVMTTVTCKDASKTTDIRCYIDQVLEQVLNSPMKVPASTSVVPASAANLHCLPLKTKITLKPPLEGRQLGPFGHPPAEEFFRYTLDMLRSDDWQTNINGLEAVVRFSRHHHRLVLMEYKTLLPLVMKHVKNLRLQRSPRDNLLFLGFLRKC